MDAPSIKRRLAAILAADAVGYSKHMARDEEGTLRVLSGHRVIIDGLIATFSGRIVGTAGDSVLAEFGSSVDAVRCAVEIQAALATRNDSLSESGRLLFRIGINLGDVIVEGDDILGDGVNVAARLESIAEPGGICVSSSIYDQISGKLNLGFADMGHQSLKNIGRPVRTYMVARDGAEPALSQEGPAPSSAAPASKGSATLWLAAAGAVGLVIVAVMFMGGRRQAGG
ncbi:MAG: adenylate/guanylate cyclase domain-containing protein, partial [Vicinamibacterales bacterium]